MAFPRPNVLRSQLYLCSYVHSTVLAENLRLFLNDEQYALADLQSESNFFEVILQQKHEIDCLILEETSSLPKLIHQLHQEAVALPAIILTSNPQEIEQLPAQVSLEVLKGFERASKPIIYYHSAEVHLLSTDCSQIMHQIELAISQFLRLSFTCRLPTPGFSTDVTQELAPDKGLQLQQHRLSEKLRERLGYLGVYYKRDSKSFFRHLPEPEQRACLDELKSDYRAIVLSYFRHKEEVNKKIDDFVNKAFFLDVSVSQVLEIHMELMDGFAKQLKLEGRSEDVLLDYRLTLIDTIAHLCEMYRRSIPRSS